jgi:hypothetical protein
MLLDDNDDDDDDKPVWPRWAASALTEDDDENKPVWPTLAVGILSDAGDAETCNCGCPSERSLRNCLNSPSLISCGTYNRLCQRRGACWKLKVSMVSFLPCICNGHDQDDEVVRELGPKKSGDFLQKCRVQHAGRLDDGCFRVYASGSRV